MTLPSNEDLYGCFVHARREALIDHPVGPGHYIDADIVAMGAVKRDLIEALAQEADELGAVYVYRDQFDDTFDDGPLSRWLREHLG